MKVVLETLGWVTMPTDTLGFEKLELVLETVPVAFWTVRTVTVLFRALG